MSKRVTITFAPIVGIIMLMFIIALFSASGLVSYRLYKRVLATESAQATIFAQQQEDQQKQAAQAKELIEIQQKALDEAKLELTQTKTNAEKTTAEVKTLSAKLSAEQSVPKDIIISSSDLAPYTTGVVQVICTSGSSVSSGSGTLFTFKEVEHAVLTNYHVVRNADSCVILLTNNANEQTGAFTLDGEVYTFNKNTDEAVLKINTSISNKSVPVGNYNYALAHVKKCTNNMPIGTPVVVIGFPAYAKRDATIDISTIGTVNVIYRTVTNGIISGYDSSTKGSANYFVSAKIDNGNSGGMALAKDTRGLCTLGLPTWLTVGNYETQGLVQNINNVLPE